MTATAFTHADVLRRIAGDDPIESHTALATEFGRDPSNLRKTMKALESEGLILRPEAERPTLTDLGRQVLHGIDVAEGVASDSGDASPAPRWPLDKIRRNPSNRVIPEISGLAMAEEILGFGDVIVPATLTPPDANGVRMLLAGERRWFGSSILAGLHGDDLMRRALGGAAMPAALADGLPFVEREADEATAILITIVENGAREDLSPWEDAQQLLKLAEKTGWSGAEIARRTGRASETRKNGAKDVQDKLKIAREATPDAISDYLRSGSWDDLRNSVRDRKPVEADPDQLPMFEDAGLVLTVADHGIDAEWDPRDVVEAATLLEPDTLEILTFVSSSKGIYPRASIQVAKLVGGACWLSGSEASHSKGGYSSTLNGVWSSREPAYPSREAAIRAEAERIVHTMGDRMTPELRRWLDAPGVIPTGPYVVNGVDYHNASRAAEARRAAGIDPTPAANGGGSAPTAPAPDQPAELTALARLALVELTIKIKHAPKPTGGEHDPERPLSSSDLPGAWARYGAPIGAYWTDPAFAELTKAGLIRVVHQKHGQPTLAALTDKGVAFLGDYLPPNMLSQGVALQPVTGSLLPPEGQAYFTGWLETESRPASAPQVAQQDEQDADDDRDDFGRDADAVAADIALLGEVQTFYHNDDEEPDEAAAMALMRRLGVTGPFEEDGDGGLTALVNGKVEALAFIDIDRTMPDDRSRAIGMLVAWACRVVFGGQG